MIADFVRRVNEMAEKGSYWPDDEVFSCDQRDRHRLMPLLCVQFVFRIPLSSFYGVDDGIRTHDLQSHNLTP